MNRPTTRRYRPAARLSGQLLMFLTLATACAPGVRVAPPVQMQAWVVYYDPDRGLNEVRSHGDLFDRISLFAYELSPDGRPRPAPNLARMIPRFLRFAQDNGFEPWVTVVNDVRFGRDSAILKDAGIVHDIISDEVRRLSHARELAQRAHRDGFAGLHLDYERVEQSDSSEFRAFVELLQESLEGAGLGLEVILEPSYGPVPSPNTTNVTVMGYDQHGPHSGPGPRATPEFVSALNPRAIGDDDGEAGLAIALSGFAWKPGGEVATVDWAEAGQLTEDATTLQRSSAAGVPSARLDDGTEIWFEDAESILRKWDAAWESGFRRLLLWRLGGNDERLFSMLRDLRDGGARRQ